jgi:hypothetical protein
MVIGHARLMPQVMLMQLQMQMQKQNLVMMHVMAKMGAGLKQARVQVVTVTGGLPPQ